MEFKNFTKQVQNQFAEMCKTGKLFRVDVSGSEIWKQYLAGFKPEYNGVFRDPESSVHNCNNCHNFIRRYGNIVSINSDGKLDSIFSNLNVSEEYENSVKAINELIISSKIRDVFFETFNELNSLPYEACKKDNQTFQLGIANNLKKYTQEEVNKFGVVNSEKIYEFNHFNLQLPKKFVNCSGNSVEQIMAQYRDKYNVFKRAMEEISLDTLNLVKDLINQGSLLDGNAHIHLINKAIANKVLYDAANFDKNIACWIATYDMDEATAKFKNTLIGVLCSELAEGMELNKACENWNKRVDPANYHKATAPITKKQIKEAKKFVEENGYVESFDRRLATIDDIRTSEIKHINVGDGTIKSVSIFDNVKSTSTRHKRSEFNKLESVSIEKFMKDILPSCTSVEAFFENRMEGNLVTLTTSKIEDSKLIFKWDNNYSWTFNGNLAGKSQIKQAVKNVGGNVDGVLNFRLAWNDGDGKDSSDLDARAREPNNTNIGFSSGFRKDSGNRRTSMSGQLDVDNMNPSGKLAVENITWINKNEMRDGTYKLWVNQFSARNSQGFKAEIEFDGEIYSYEYNQPLGYKVNIQVAEITLKNGEFTIKHYLPETSSSKELWGLETNNFHKVDLICLSPNHWNENNVGNLHYMFMLNNCKVDTPVRGFHNENLIPEILKHKKVMEVLGTTNMIEPTKKQLSGIGFNSTVKDELIVKCSGNFKRMLKITF